MFETQISAIQIDGVIARLGFPNSFRIKANGFVGGGLVVWTENILTNILELHPQMIYMRFKVGKDPLVFLCSVVYASPQLVMTHKLLQCLDSLMESIIGSWVIAGYFN